MALELHSHASLDRHVNLVINGLTGHLCSVSLDPSCKPEEMQVLVEAVTGIPRGEQRFFCGPTELPSDESIGKFVCEGLGDESGEEVSAELLLIRQQQSFVRLPRYTVSKACETIDSGLMTIEEAKDRVNSLPNCYGFTFARSFGTSYPAGQGDVEFKGREGFQVAKAIGSYGSSSTFVRLRGPEDHQFLLGAVDAKDAGAVSLVSEVLRDDSAFMLPLIMQNGNALQYASERLQADPEVVAAAVEQAGAALLYASNALRDDREIVMTAVVSDGHALAYASDRLRSDCVLVLAALRSNGHALKHADLALRCDPTMVETAVRQNGHAFQHAARSLRSDPDFAARAITLSGDAARYAVLEPAQPQRSTCSQPALSSMWHTCLGLSSPIRT